MRVDCPSCPKHYDIPDERLPFGKKVSFPCPACKGIIDLDLRPKESKVPPERPAGDSGEGRPPDSNEAKPIESQLATGQALKEKIIQNLDYLPSMPKTVIKARQIMANPGSDIKEIAAILETDQAVAARVLKIANSSYYGRSGKIGSIEQASVLLGHKTLGEIITMAGASNLLGDTLDGYDLEAGELWRHSMAVAFGSRIIAEKKFPQLSEDAFLAGLIHDAGKLILDSYVQERKDLFFQLLQKDQQSFLKAEKQILGFDHPEIAFEVCKRWNFPIPLLIAVRYHHNPLRSQENHLTYIVYLADCLAISNAIGTGIEGSCCQINDQVLEFLDIDEADQEEVLEGVLESLEQVTAKFSES